MSERSSLRQAQGDTGSGRGPSTQRRGQDGASSGLERAIARLRRPRERDDSAPAQLSTAAFQAAVHERLRNLERNVDEVKGRVNGLIFLLAGTVAAQLVLRLAG